MDALRNRNSQIGRIGIDFGAWVQEYPHSLARTAELKNDAIEAIARTAAEKVRFEAYQKAHNEILGAGKKWILPETQLSQEDPGLDEGYPEHAKNAFERDFYVDAGGSASKSLTMVTSGPISCQLDQSEVHQHQLFQDVEDAKARTLMAVLGNLHKIAVAHEDFELFALEPEWQEKSTDPVHPFALLQGHSSKVPSTTALTPAVYQWLNTTFNWRPVFDWDCFLGSDHKGLYEALLQRWRFYAKPSKPGDIVRRVAEQLKRLSDAGIPVHILIGRLHPDQLSLYWGAINDNAGAWAKWLRTPMEAHLLTIAPLITTLTIMYDLRNPLLEDRLLAIEASQPDNKDLDNTTCLRPICPWRKKCPFPRYPAWSPFSSSYYFSGQEMANGRSLKNEMSDVSPGLQDLAPNHISLPPTGHLPSTPDDEDTLHVRTRNAVFAQEAITWQKFWTAYAPQLTALKILNIRMPKLFDGTGSVKLATLLDKKNGWEMKAWANEISLGSGETVKDGRLVVEDGERIWPAGQFVRRTWVRKPTNRWNDKGEEEEKKPEALHRDCDMVEEPFALERDVDIIEIPYMDSLERPEQNVADPVFSEDEEVRDVEEKEKEELDKAITRAEEAARLARELEAELEAKSTSTPRTVTTLERRLRTVYGRRVRRVAQHAWEERVKEHLLELANTEEREVLSATRTELQARLLQFRCEDVFMKQKGMRDDIGLVLDDREYAQEEEERRGGPLHGADGDDGNGQSGWNLDDSDSPYGGGNELELGVEEDLLRSTPSPLAQDPKNDTLPVGVQDPEQLKSLYGTTPPADATITISPVDKPMQGITVGSRRLEGVFADLKTYGGVLTLPDAGTSGTLSNLRQSTEVEETRVTVAQSGSTTAETTTTAVMVSTEIIETLPTPTLPGIEMTAPDTLEVPSNPWLNLKPNLVFVPTERDPIPPSPREAQEPKEPISSLQRGIVQAEEPVGTQIDMPEVLPEQPALPAAEPTTKKPISAKSTLPKPTPVRKPTPIKGPTPARKPTSVNLPALPRPAPLKSSQPKVSPPRPSLPEQRVQQPPKEPTAPGKEPRPPPKKTSKQQPVKKFSPPKKVKKGKGPASSPTPFSPASLVQAPLTRAHPTQVPSASPAPVKRVTRKDPVLADFASNKVDEISHAASTARATRAMRRSRSGTPVYKEISSEEDEDEGKNKRKADEEWSGGGAKRKRKRGKKGD
jgi:hypothetical protein